MNMSKALSCMISVSLTLLERHRAIENSLTKHVCEIYTPYTLLLHGEKGVYRGIPIFLIFDQKHRLWVITINVWEKVLKMSKFFY